MKDKVVNEKTDQIANISDVKNHFIKCLGILEDLKIVKNEEVKKFIFKEIYSYFNVIETNTYHLYDKINLQDKQINMLKEEINSMKNIHDIQLKVLNESHQDELQNLEQSKKDNENDLINKAILNQIQDEEIPDYEEQFYKAYSLNESSQLSDLSDVDSEVLTMDEIMNPYKIDKEELKSIISNNECCDDHMIDEQISNSNSNKKSKKTSKHSNKSKKANNKK